MSDIIHQLGINLVFLSLLLMALNATVDFSLFVDAHYRAKNNTRPATLEAAKN